jgi:hypothetical protein
MPNISASPPTPAQNPLKPFPAWRLPKGAISASDSALEKSIESCERWEWFGGGLVVVGVIAEVAIAAMHPPYDSFWEQWGSSVANGLVAIGVVLEIKFGQMAGLRQNELKRRSDENIAAATERAAAAELRTEQLRQAMSWRHLDKGRFLKALGDVVGSAQIAYVDNDPESFHFSVGLQLLLSAAKWNVSEPQPIPYNLKHGSLLVGSSALPVSANGVTILANSPESADNSGTPHRVLETALVQNLGPVDWRRDAKLSPDCLLVVVAPKS